MRDALAAQLPVRLAQARQHPGYREAVACVPSPPVTRELAVTSAVLGAIVVALWTLAAAKGGGERWTLAITGSLLCAACYSWRWAEFQIKCRGRLRRQLYVVLDKRSLRIGGFARYTLTLWTPAIQPFQIVASRHMYYRCDIGDVGLAVFRGRHLRELLRLAPDHAGAGSSSVRRPAPRLRGSLSLLHPAAVGALPRFDEQPGMSCCRPRTP